MTRKVPPIETQPVLDLGDLHLSNEDRLLLHCARLDLRPEDAAALSSLLSHGVDWAAVEEKAAWHQMFGLLYRHLRNETFRHDVPEMVLARAAAVYHRTVARRLYQRAELARVLEVMARLGIPVMLLKGAALAESVFSDPGLRPMTDVDILVPQECLDIAYQAIQDMGYTPRGSKETQERTRAEHRHLPLLESRDRRVFIEVHHQMTRRDSRMCLPVDRVWKSGWTLAVAGRPALAPGPEYMLLHLCAHFFLDRRFHSGAALRQLCDIAETIARYPGGIDWKGLIAESTDLGVDRPVGCVLFLARLLLAAPVPDGVLEALGPIGPERAQVLLFLRRRVLDTRPWLAHDLAPAHASATGLVRSAVRRLFPDRVTLAERYRLDPRSWRTSLYYPVRVYHVLARLAATGRRASTVREDLALDRWMQSLYPQRDVTS